jgi:hypothetical protein
MATIVAVVGTAALIAARQSFPGADWQAMTEAMETEAASPEPAADVASSERTSSTRLAAKTAQSHAMDRTLPVERLKKPRAKPAAAALPIEPVEAYEATPAAMPMPSPPPTRESAESPTKPDLSSAAVTIEGCVSREDDGFWLRDTSGEAAPKSRTWKLGFLKKRSAAIYLVDSRDGVKLDEYVGRRVAATGTLIDREMRPRSLRQVAAVCN